MLHGDISAWRGASTLRIRDHAALSGRQIGKLKILDCDRDLGAAAEVVASEGDRRSTAKVQIGDFATGGTGVTRPCARGTSLKRCSFALSMCRAIPARWSLVCRHPSERYRRLNSRCARSVGFA